MGEFNTIITPKPISLGNNTSADNESIRDNEISKSKITIEEKWLNSGDKDAKEAAVLLRNIKAVSLGTAVCNLFVRVGDDKATRCNLLFNTYKIYDFNNASATGRNDGKFFETFSYPEGAQITYIAIPQKYIGANSDYLNNKYEKYDEADISQYEDVSDVRLYALSNSYPVKISTLAQAEYLRQECEYRNLYYFVLSKGELKPISCHNHENIAYGIIKTYIPSEFDNLT